MDRRRFNVYGGTRTRRSDEPGGGVDLVANMQAAGFKPHLPPKVWCFVRSYHGDAQWLAYALRWGGGRTVRAAGVPESGQPP